MRKKKEVGEFVLDALAECRIPNTDSELKKTTINVWDEQKIIILDFKIPLPIEKERKLSIVLTKKELKALCGAVLP